jgi:hypothetical protein
MFGMTVHIQLFGLMLVHLLVHRVHKASLVHKDHKDLKVCLDHKVPKVHKVLRVHKDHKDHRVLKDRRVFLVVASMCLALSLMLVTCQVQQMMLMLTL